jgi:hypothetical protein
VTADRDLAQVLAELDIEELAALAEGAADLADRVDLNDDWPGSPRLAAVFEVLAGMALEEQARRDLLFARLERHFRGTTKDH